MWNPETELEAVRQDLCEFCFFAIANCHYSHATRKARKNGKLIRWEHVFDGDKSNAIACLAGASREREFQEKNAQSDNRKPAQG